MPAVCPHCGSARLGGLGAGTQRLGEELERLFPMARIARLDRDSSRGRGEPERILAAFSRREADLLVGTQMVAKGHDLAGVTVVGVVLADQGLRYPDLRAAERTAQLLVQAAGRAGRGERPGRVFLQTYEPEHGVIQAACRHDYLSFAEEELGRRRELGYPPYGVMAVLTLSAVEEERVETAAAALAAAWAAEPRGRLLGPAPPPVPRLDGRHRRQLMVLAGDGRVARDAARALLAVRLPAAVRLDVLVDPA
jgi:primosomal protein N' (replication factor Y)